MDDIINGNHFSNKYRNISNKLYSFHKVSFSGHVYYVEAKIKQKYFFNMKRRPLKFGKKIILVR